jgi:hypothetical protein
LASAVGTTATSSGFFYLTTRIFDLTTGAREATSIDLSEFGRSLMYAANPQQEEQLLKQAFQCRIVQASA